MKKPLPLVVMALALALCGLCLVQWVREANLRKQLGTLTQENADKTSTIATLESRLKAWEADIQRLSARVDELKAAESTHNAALILAERARAKTEIDLVQSREEADAYKKGFDAQNENLKRQNASIAQQNQVIEEQNGLLKELGEERNKAVEQLNARTRDFNGVVEKYNALVKQIEEQQTKK
jgi:chromosome segregation ATPase